MSTTHQDKSSDKPRQRSRKAGQRGQKTDQQQTPKFDQREEDQIGAMIASTDTPANAAAAPAEVPSSGAPAPADVALIGEVAPADALSIGAPADDHPISIQTIAIAYGNYTKKSFQETRSFVEKCMGAQSFDKAIEFQTEFARQASANFVAESQNILELYSELARQIFKPWEFLRPR